MASPLLLTAGALFVLYWANYTRALLRNIAAAKASGIAYVVLPWNPFYTFWLASYQIWLPLLQKLPASWTSPWLLFMNPEWTYLHGHAPFEKMGSDCILTVSSGRLQLYIADAEVITQVTTRRNDFPKPLQMYKRLDIYGKNVVSTEGATWRQHRKMTAPSFTEKNNELVFKETLHHGQALVRLWTGESRRESRTIQDSATDTMRFALYVISSAGFDVRVLWSHEEKENTGGANSVGSTAPPGHKLSYRDAISSLLENILWTQVFPKWVLENSPFEWHKELNTAVTEWGKYMEDMYEARKREVISGHSSAASGLDLFGALISRSGIASTASDSKTPDSLSKSDILGNGFVFTLAGHETTANALNFSLIYLALNRPQQQHLQADIDAALGGKPIAQWTYDADFPPLFGSMPAAVMNETLRLIPPVINIPKCTPADRPQPVTTNATGGRRVCIPANATVSLSCAAVHKNPRYWPTAAGLPQGTDGVHDVELFRPERWLLRSKPAAANASSTAAHVDETYDDDDMAGPSGADVSAALFKPEKGAYIPFSEGYRSCLGRRFSQVELCAVLALIFRDYSVELAVEEWASDEEVERMGVAERREVWGKAARRADGLLKTALTSIITLQMRGERVPIRLVRRGAERFLG
ncbi:cytochrome P450 monooxygenase-like protein [Mytilinidion resinicola]|uniref:Cytochrome P450 monooxygenase-like protein n=1 Tax=Mytilinidion resinicola TaxID=574789 RepID=A0A6A6XZS3_9PEZI|nr:cytochrome P450 monooxygenase-like protein [Mytilinidion resinicola]KAF2802022.1 cytochrome P450 monooxygenase-like protein [Mytilinidion resinicola]